MANRGMRWEMRIPIFTVMFYDTRLQGMCHLIIHRQKVAVTAQIQGFSRHLCKHVQHSRHPNRPLRPMSSSAQNSTFSALPPKQTTVSQESLCTWIVLGSHSHQESCRVAVGFRRTRRRSSAVALSLSPSLIISWVLPAISAPAA